LYLWRSEFQSSCIRWAHQWASVLFSEAAPGPMSAHYLKRNIAGAGVPVLIIGIPPVD
ncbi:unnamed protein product, partial [Ceratitis capitata]